MRRLILLGLIAGLPACTYVERERPAPVVLQQPQAPTYVAPAPPPVVVVRPSY